MCPCPRWCGANALSTIVAFSDLAANVSGMRVIHDDPSAPPAMARPPKTHLLVTYEKKWARQCAKDHESWELETQTGQGGHRATNTGSTNSAQRHIRTAICWFHVDYIIGRPAARQSFQKSCQRSEDHSRIAEQDPPVVRCRVGPGNFTPSRSQIRT